MRKSISGFILGLIGGLFLTGAGACYAFAGGAATDIGNSLQADMGGMTIIIILSWLLFVGGILAIVGAALCFKKSKLGGIFLLIATALSLAFYIYFFIQGGAALGVTTIIFSIIPSILTLIGGILALKGKLVENVAIPQYNGGYNQYGTNPYAPQQPNPYAQPNNPYAQHNPYAQPNNPYAPQPNPYNQPNNAYGPNPYAQPNQPNPYASQQPNPYNQPNYAPQNNQVPPPSPLNTAPQPAPKKDNEGK